MVENGVPMFVKIKNGGETQLEIEVEKPYYIPGDATHIGVHDGRVAFFISGWPVHYKNGRKWRFWKIPEILGSKGERVNHLAFPEYKFGAGGHHYGCPEFFP